MEVIKRPTVLIVGAIKLGAECLTDCLEELVKRSGFGAAVVPHYSNLKQHLWDRKTHEIVIFPFADMDGTTIEECMELVPKECVVMALYDGLTQQRIFSLNRINMRMRKPFKNEEFVMALLRLVPKDSCQTS